MAKNAISKNKIVTTVIGVIVIVIMLVVVGSLVVILRNKNTAFVMLNGKALENGETLSLNDEPLSFTVNAKNYTVSITPYPEATDFTIIADGNSHSFIECRELTEAFPIKETDEGFELSSPLYVWRVVDTLFPESEIDIDGTLNFANEPYFLLTIASEDVEYTFPLVVPLALSVSDIELNPEDITF